MTYSFEYLLTMSTWLSALIFFALMATIHARVYEAAGNLPDRLGPYLATSDSGSGDFPTASEYIDQVRWALVVLFLVWHELATAPFSPLLTVEPPPPLFSTRRLGSMWPTSGS